ncbi:hypothetical protein DNHGIG_36110 [Collibacillus ludicampi]|uniref:Uncharacterized protein n=1 Tax=Collibacillus ludicampi TaxID=2771369 RepID=A0AAV4LJP0_9BACL|nr:hypothetical protein [Collibacillus ludicampi]GIM48062.1 hypothetical protein DNHGIG_36110 [Collibacillus ludicampi]
MQGRNELESRLATSVMIHSETTFTEHERKATPTVPLISKFVLKALSLAVIIPTTITNGTKT